MATARPVLLIYERVITPSLFFEKSDILTEENKKEVIKKYITGIEKMKLPTNLNSFDTYFQNAKKKSYWRSRRVFRYNDRKYNTN